MTRRGVGHGRAAQRDRRAVDARERVDAGAVRRGMVSLHWLGARTAGARSSCWTRLNLSTVVAGARTRSSTPVRPGRTAAPATVTIRRGSGLRGFRREDRVAEFVIAIGVLRLVEGVLCVGEVRGDGVDEDAQGGEVVDAEVVPAGEERADGRGVDVVVVGWRSATTCPRHGRIRGDRGGAQRILQRGARGDPWSGSGRAGSTCFCTGAAATTRGSPCRATARGSTASGRTRRRAIWCARWPGSCRTADRRVAEPARPADRPRQHLGRGAGAQPPQQPRRGRQNPGARTARRRVASTLSQKGPVQHRRSCERKAHRIGAACPATGGSSIGNSQNGVVRHLLGAVGEHGLRREDGKGP